MKQSLPHLTWLLLATAVGADEPHPEFVGRYLARTDSIGFDAYRALGDDAQISRREEARRWVKRGNEQHEKALDEYATAVGLCPYVPEAWLRFGEAHLLRGFDAAADWCAGAGMRTLRFEPHEPKRLEIETSLHQLKARVSYNLGDFTASLEAVNAALDGRPAERDLRLLRARVLGAIGQFAEARAALSEFGVQDPAYAQAQGILGNVELAAGRLTPAREAFAIAHERGLRGAVFENDRGRLELALPDYQRAMGHFRAAIELRPDFVEARSNLAVAQRRAGDLAAAQATLEGIVELRPDFAPAHFNLAELLRDAANASPAAAAPALRARSREHYALALRHGYDPAAVMERRAGLATEGDELGAAEEDLLEMTKDPRIDGRVLHKLARVKRDQGDFRVAMQLLLLAKSRDYDAPELHSDLGEMYLRSGDSEAARDELQLALAGNPELIVTRVNLSIALAKLGDLEGADRELGEAEKRAPEHPLVQAQRTSLTSQRGG